MQSILSTLRKRWKLVAGIVGAFVAIVVLVALLGRSQQARIAEELAAGLRSARIGRDELIVTASATGRLEAVSDANLAFLAPGEVAIINVKEGDVVSAGDVLASLDSASLELSLKDAELAHALQVLALEELKSDPSEAQLALAKASVSQAGAQLNLVARPPTDDEIRIAELGVELARNQLFERQSSRDLSEDRSGPGVSTAMGNQQAFGAELGVDAAELQLEQMDAGCGLWDGHHRICRVGGCSGPAEHLAGGCQAKPTWRLLRIRLPWPGCRLRWRRTCLMMLKSALHSTELLPKSISILAQSPLPDCQ